MLLHFSHVTILLYCTTCGRSTLWYIMMIEEVLTHSRTTTCSLPMCHITIYAIGGRKSCTHFSVFIKNHVLTSLRVLRMARIWSQSRT